MIISIATFEHLPKRVGGLAEAATSIGESLASDNEVMIFMPSHNMHETEKDLDPKEYGRFKIRAPFWESEVTVYEARRKGVRIFLLSDEVMNHPEVYTPRQNLSAKLVHFALAFPAAVNMIMGKEGKKPDVVHLNDWHCVLGGAMVKKYFQIPVIYTIHRICKEKIELEELYSSGLDEICDPSCIELVDDRKMFNLETFGCKMCDRLNTVSYSYLNEEWDSLFGYYAGKATYVWNGIDYSFWNPKELKNSGDRRERRKALLRENGLEDGPMFFYVGRFDMEQKGVDHLLRATNMIMEGKVDVPEEVKDNLRVLILGSGDQKLEELAKKMESMYPDNVKTVIGYLSRETTREYYGASDFTVVPSNFEPFGLVQLEAMCMGSIPLGSAVGGIKDTVIDISRGREMATGKLVPPRDPKALAEAMVELASLEMRDPKLIEKVRSNGRPHVTQNFTWKKATERYMKLYSGDITIKLPFADFEGPF